MDGRRLRDYYGLHSRGIRWDQVIISALALPPYFCFPPFPPFRHIHPLLLPRPPSPVRNAPMFWRISSGLARLSSWRRPQHRAGRAQKRSLYRWILAIVAALGGLILVYLFVVPQILRFRFRTDLSWYDLGFHGFGPSQSYVSFDEDSPVVQISPPGAQCDGRYTFLAPRGDSVAYPGPMILDARGELVWTRHQWGTTQDFRVQRYRGEAFLTYWQGDEEDAHGRGSWYMVSGSVGSRGSRSVC